MTQTIGFIGGGNMARSLIGGLLADGYAADLLWVSNKTPEKVQKLQAAFGINVAENNQQICTTCDVVIFAVKPQILQAVAKELAAVIQQKRPLVISIAAGVRTNDLERFLGGDIAVVRTMPNTPALLGCGATGLYATQQVNAEQRALAESIMRAVGVAVWLNDEKQLDALTAISGSGPAYFFLIMEILQKTAEKMGLKTDDARLLVLQTALGAAKMAMESDEPPAELRKHVTSPNGVTEQAIASFQAANLDEIFERAVQAGRQRAETLAEQLGEEE
jgi:pyrroline-5-carboxylate reductase